MTEEFLLLLAIGFLAQLVDGALGMAFGVISTSAMLMIGVPPAQASALVHTAEVFTTGASAASHIYHRNVDWRLVIRLGIAGVIGAVLGAWVLSNLDAKLMRPFVCRLSAADGDLHPDESGADPAAARRAGGLDRAGRLRRRLSRCQRRRRLGAGRDHDAGRLGPCAASDGRLGQRHGILRHHRGGHHVLCRAWRVAAAEPVAAGDRRADRGAARRLGGEICSGADADDRASAC